MLSLAFRILGRFVLIFIIARIYSLNEFGIFTYSLTVAGVFGLLFDYGYNLKYLKDFPNNTSEIPASMGRAIVTKFFIMAIFFTILLLSNVESIFNVTRNEAYILYLFFISSAFISITNLLLVPFKATNRFYIETMVLGVDAVILLTSIVSIYLYTDSYLYTIYAYVMTKCLVMLLAWYFYYKNYSLQLKVFNLISELKSVFPYGIHYFIGGVYLSVDTLILKHFVSNDEMAVYQAGLRILMASSMLLSVINQVFLPRLSAYDNKSHRFYMESCIVNRYIMLLGILLALFLLLFQEPIIYILFGEGFKDLDQIYYYLVAIISLRYFGAVYGLLLTISGNQSIRAIAVTFTLFFIIIADYFIIPNYFIIGAAQVLLAAHIIVNAIYLYFTYKEYGSFFIKYGII
jgi:O-antigen/teichoic acid export membrane protein